MPGIGVFGGTFDPVHLGHLRAAEEFARALELERVLMLPSARPPHRAQAAAGAGQRMTMLELALAGNPRLLPCDLEIRRGGASYTCDTLEELARTEGRPLTLALGADAWREIASWHRPGQVLSSASVVVLTRPGSGGTERLLEPLPPALRELYRPREEGGYLHRQGTTLGFLEVTPLDISSTRIRALVAAGGSIRYLVPEAVLQYIDEEGLYRQPARHEKKGSAHLES